MRKSYSRLVAASTILFILIAACVARDQKEDARIAGLIQSIESLHDAKFIRNGTAYDSKKAVDHLRLKLRNAGERVRTAEDFIEGCASKSSMSGEKYRIRFADGKEMDTEQFFRQKLKEFDQGSH